jgi:mono/diheme cytochrome c family protein
LLKYFPGQLEPIATIVIPGLVFGFLFALPFIDRGHARHPMSRGRAAFTMVMLVIASATGTLTYLGLRDRPQQHTLQDWGLLSIAGMQIATRTDSTCVRCHEPGGPAAPLAITRLSKDEEWLLTHMADPVAIAPGVRSVTDPAPRPVMSRFQAQAVVSYLRHVRGGATPPTITDELQLAATTYANICVVCHKMNGEGGVVGPDLTHIGARRTVDEIRDVIEDASLFYGESTMPTFKNKLTPDQIGALARYLASRK